MLTVVSRILNKHTTYGDFMRKFNLNKNNIVKRSAHSVHDVRKKINYNYSVKVTTVTSAIILCP